MRTDVKPLNFLTFDQVFCIVLYIASNVAKMFKKKKKKKNHPGSVGKMVKARGHVKGQLAGQHSGAEKR